MNRKRLAEAANEAGRSSRRRGAPRLHADSPREDVLRWLQWNDPNGGYLDPEPEPNDDGDLVMYDDREPLTKEEAWEYLSRALEE